MIRAGVGHSQSLSTAEAAERATLMAMGNAGIAKADLAIVFATINYQTEYQELFSSVQACSGCERLVGGSGMSVLTSAGEFEGQPALAVMVIRSEQMSAISFSMQGTESEIATQIRHRVHPEMQENSLLIVLPDIRSMNPTELVKQVGTDGEKLPIVGAAISGDATGAQMYHWAGHEAREGGVAGVMLTGEFHTEVGVAQGCQPVGKPYEITKSQGRIIFELDGSPALERFKQTLQLLTREDIRQSGGMVFAGIAMDAANREPARGDFLIRNLVGVNEEHAAIALSEKVEDGQLVQFHLRNAPAAKAEIRSIIEQLSEKTWEHPPAFGLYFNCLGRGKGLYGELNHDITVIEEKFPGVPVIGFFGNSEFAPIGNENFVHTYTGVLVLCSAA